MPNPLFIESSSYFVVYGALLIRRFQRQKVYLWRRFFGAVFCRGDGRGGVFVFFTSRICRERWPATWGQAGQGEIESVCFLEYFNADKEKYQESDKLSGDAQLKIIAKQIPMKRK